MQQAFTLFTYSVGLNFRRAVWLRTSYGGLALQGGLLERLQVADKPDPTLLRMREPISRIGFVVFHLLLFFGRPLTAAHARHGGRRHASNKRGWPALRLASAAEASCCCALGLVVFVLGDFELWSAGEKETKRGRHCFVTYIRALYCRNLL